MSLVLMPWHYRGLLRELGDAWQRGSVEHYGVVRRVIDRIEQSGLSMNETLRDVANSALCEKSRGSISYPGISPVKLTDRAVSTLRRWLRMVR